MTLRFNLVLACIGLAFSSLLFAHGEDKPGPHGGFIRMPGAFHTEVIPAANGFKVMLLDISFKNPITDNAALKASITSEKGTILLHCKPQTNYFFCTADKADLSTGTLTIKANRDDNFGITTYSLPLSFSNL